MPHDTSSSRRGRGDFRLSNEQEDEFLRRYFAGEVARTLAKEFGVSHGYYDHLLERRGLSRRAPVSRAKPKPQKPTYEQRFFARVASSNNPDDCREWQAGRFKKTGYGRVSYRGKSDYAHRVAWMLANGKESIPPGIVIRHRCDNPPCCNPNHLIPGTHLDNMRDRDERGRGKGAENLRRYIPPRPFTSDEEQDIVALYLAGTPGTEIAQQFRVSAGTIYRVLRDHGVAISRQCRPYKIGRHKEEVRDAA